MYKRTNRDISIWNADISILNADISIFSYVNLAFYSYNAGIYILKADISFKIQISLFKIKQRYLFLNRDIWI